LEAGSAPKAKGKTGGTIGQAAEDVDEATEVATSFGMFWRRGAVEWTPKPRVLGMQQIGATR
jgi:hypothetical protein